MTMRTLRIVTVAGLLAMTVAVFAQGPRTDGRWEIKVEMQMAGMTMPPQTVTQCVTPEQAADPQKAIPPAGRGQSASDCKISDYKTSGNDVTWTMACPSQQMTGSGKFTYAGDTYTGAMVMKMQGQEMTMKYSGKRLGDCAK